LAQVREKVRKQYDLELIKGFRTKLIPVEALIDAFNRHDPDRSSLPRTVTSPT